MEKQGRDLIGMQLLHSFNILIQVSNLHPSSVSREYIEINFYRSKSSYQPQQISLTEVSREAFFKPELAILEQHEFCSHKQLQCDMLYVHQFKLDIKQLFFKMIIRCLSMGYLRYFNQVHIRHIFTGGNLVVDCLVNFDLSIFLTQLMCKVLMITTQMY